MRFVITPRYIFFSSIQQLSVILGSVIRQNMYHKDHLQSGISPIESQKGVIAVRIIRSVIYYVQR